MAPGPQSRTAINSVLAVCAIVSAATGLNSPVSAAQPEPATPIDGVLRQFCLECHSDEHAEAGINLQQLASPRSFATGFRHWQRVIAQLEQGRMPPGDAAQPAASQRQRLIAGIRAGLRQAAKAQAGDPGRIVMRRLTSAEYAYTIADLSGLDLELQLGLPGDAVGGAGFTNTGIAQFVQDSTLQRYLEAAKQVAEHAVIGAGALAFHQDPGRTGFELSAIARIQDIYRTHGFRTAAGEGGEAFGLEKYPRAFYAAWLFRHRARLGRPAATLGSLAAEEGIDARFAEYIHDVLTQGAPSFPTSDIVDRWRKLPVPDEHAAQRLDDVRGQCQAIAQLMHDWQSRFGANADAKEEAPVLRADLFEVNRRQPFEMNINWPRGTEIAHLVLTIESAIRDGKPDAIIVWRKPEIQYRVDDQRLEDPRPLRSRVVAPVAERLGFGTHPRGGTVGPDDFVTTGTGPLAFELPIPPGASSAQLLVAAELDTTHGEDCIVRCTIAQLEETDQGKSVSALLANPGSPAFSSWKAGVLDFARLLPQVSQREPAPSDRDPIPPPFDSSYNNPERNDYHTRIKYHRDDRFLVENILDAATRVRLDHAWADLLGSFEFHDAWLRFVAQKYQIALDGRGMAQIDEAWIAALPPEPRGHVRRLYGEYHAIQSAFAAARPGHVEDVVQFAARAWRRPLSPAEEERLRNYYRTLRTQSKLAHRPALRALIARVLVAPDFLYRAERVAQGTGVTPLSDWELASRLSYFLWSSPPDDELRRAAAEGELSDPGQLVRQSRRMLKHPQARRFATEFFGQWFGFYRFDRYRGVDPERFPEFSDTLKAAMYDEAVTLFEHIVRKDRPPREILFADYAFLNRELAEHYDIQAELPASPTVRKVDGLNRFHRGGLLRLGAVLTVTSAPLRTSPVKRGDWILRRILGTPVPPPPADAGSIPADDELADGLSVQQRLEAHRRDVSCVNCHARFDALGFALEQYDSLGRWRQRYRDGKPIDTSGELRDGTRISGQAGLHEYLARQQPLFHRALCTKLLAYALGRQEAIGDMPLLEGMMEHLSSGGGVWGLVESIAASRQFRYHGGEEEP